MASKPTILLIPGSFTTAPMYYPLQDTLAAQGYETYINSLPSASRNAPEPPATLGDDASFFSNIIGTIADQGKDIIVLGHSYGGMVACESAKGQSKIERRARGQDGGIVRIIFLSAIVLPEGQSVAAHQGEPPASIVTKDEVSCVLFDSSHEMLSFTVWIYETCQSRLHRIAHVRYLAGRTSACLGESLIEAFSSQFRECSHSCRVQEHPFVIHLL